MEILKNSGTDQPKEKMIEPAFPFVAPGKLAGQVVVVPGMTLRDYFAAQIISGCAYDSNPDSLAERAYHCADAMLKARAK